MPHSGELAGWYQMRAMLPSKERPTGMKTQMGKLVPVLILDIVERLLINQFPSSENVYLMCPDCTNVVEDQGQD